MFSRARMRLALRYTALVTVFLLVFNIIVYTLFVFIIRSQEKEEVRKLAEQEAMIIREAFQQNRKMPNLKMDIRTIMTLGSDQFFFYVLAPDGTLLGGSEAFPSLREVLLEKVRGWPADAEAVRYDSLKLDGSKPRFGKRELLRDAEDGVIDLIMTSQAVTIGKQTIGTLYVGKNITSHAKLFRQLEAVLAGLTLVFAGAAFALGRYMSRRAMIPIEQAYIRQREFVADASHELRTPLSVLRSSLDALALEEAVRNDPFSSRLIANMKDEVSRMTRLVGDLLTLARSDSGQPELSKEWFDFREHLTQTIEAMTPVAGAKRIALSHEAPDAIPVYGDREKLRQVLYILLDNAIKYTPEGGAVRVQAAVGGTERNRWFTLAVSDTGPGIPDKDTERIFERFYRVDRARSRPAGGHGLGLAIAKWIVEAHQGTIGVKPAFPGGESGPRGSRFEARLPQPAASKSK